MSLVRLLVWVTILSVVFGPGGSWAAEEAPTHCRFSAELVISPGLSVVPNRGSFSSGGPTGTVVCDGPVADRHVTGPGRFGASGRYGTADDDSCVSGGEGTVLQSFWLPTGRETVVIDNPATFTWALMGSAGAGDGVPPALISGAFRGPAASGTFEVHALEGDCVTRPVTRVALDGEGVFAS